MGRKMSERLIRNKRAGDAIASKINQEVRSYDEAVDSGSVADAAVNFGLEIASEKITNGLARIGLAWEDGQVSAESIKAALSAKIGAEVQDLSPEGVAQALNVSISYQVGELLGVSGLDIMGGGDLVEQARALALEAIAGGRPSKLVPLSLMRQLKRAAAFQAAGLDPQDAAKASNRARQRRHRLRYRQVWQ
jgi:hypothetical protein